MKSRWFFIAVFIFSLNIANLFATQGEFKGIKELDKPEKTATSEPIKRPNIEYRAEDSRDPFQSHELVENKSPVEESRVTETAKNPPPSLTVQGLVWGGRFPQAIINNKVVKVGDTIQEARIISIDKDGVTASFEGMQYRLPQPAAGVESSKKP